MRLEDYQDRFKTIDVTRSDDGVLELRMHSRGGPLVWGGLPHSELADLFTCVGADRETRVVIITGTGSDFVTLPEGGAEAMARGLVGPTGWAEVVWEGHRLVRALLDIDVPVIAAVNGPCPAHSELAVLADIVLCTPETYFSDEAHFVSGLVPGDGMQVIWPLLLGPNRGRYFLLTGAQLAAEDALRLGVVGEIVGSELLMLRARELAAPLAAQNPVLVRHARAVLTRPLKRAMADDLHVGLALEALAATSGREFFGS